MRPSAVNVGASGQLSIEALSAIALAPGDHVAGSLLQRARSHTRRQLSAAAAAFWREMHRELRRQAGDERLPFDLRGRLRTAAQRASDRAHHDAEAARFPRTVLRSGVALPRAESLAEKGRAAAERLGARPGQPFVAVDLRGRDHAFDASVRMLNAHGYAVIRLGLDPAADAQLLIACAFLLCDNPEAQRAAYVTNTPSLMVNATDAFTCYPVRQDGIFLLKTAIDLDTGRVLNPREFLDDNYYRNLRNTGYRDSTSDQLQDAVGEMLEGLAHGWRETPAQRRFRASAVASGESLAARVPRVATWGPVDGFIGDGRLARVQAEIAA